MNYSLRAVEPADLPCIHRLNQGALPHVSSLKQAMLEWFVTESGYFRVAHNAAGIVGFVITLSPSSAYRSPNYRWFTERFQDFVYVDRIVVAEHCHSDGIGQALYAGLVDYAIARASLITCEVNVRPTNQKSMHFHQRQGFIAIGSQNTEDGDKTVCLMARPLSSAGEALLAGMRQ